MLCVSSWSTRGSSFLRTVSRFIWSSWSMLRWEPDSNTFSRSSTSITAISLAVSLPLLHLCPTSLSPPPRLRPQHQAPPPWLPLMPRVKLLLHLLLTVRLLPTHRLEPHTVRTYKHKHTETTAYEYCTLTWAVGGTYNTI